MALFDQMYFDQKWSVWDTWNSFGRNLRVYVMTASRRITRAVTAQNRRTNVVTTPNRRSKVISTGG